MKLPIRTVRTIRIPEALDMERDRPPLPSALGWIETHDG